MGTFIVWPEEAGPEPPPANPASGIYKMIAGKTHDTLYIDLEEGEETENVKIPNPTWKTGLIPS